MLANGRRINSCLSLAVVHDGDEITTIEGLAKGSELHPVQAAFLEHDGLQCDYCTPGQICSALARLTGYKQGDASVVTPNLSQLASDPLTYEEISRAYEGSCGAYRGKTQQAGKGFSVFPSRDQPDRGLAETLVPKPSFWNVRLDTNFREKPGG